MSTQSKPISKSLLGMIAFRKEPRQGFSRSIEIAENSIFSFRRNHTEFDIGLVFQSCCKGFASEFDALKPVCLSFKLTMSFFVGNNFSKGLSSLTAKSFAEALRFWPLGSKNCIFSSFPHIDPQNSKGIIATNQLRNAFLHSVAKNKAEMCDGTRPTDFKIGRLKRLSKAPCS